MDDIKAMLSRSPMNKIDVCEEWAIHDYEGFKGLKISENEGIDRVVQLAAAIEEHGEAFAAYMEYYGDAEIDKFEERYQGSYEHKRAFTEEHYSELLDAVEKAGLNLSYVDFETLERDLFMSGFIEIREGYGTLHVFYEG
jgi:antirestriction protein